MLSATQIYVILLNISHFPYYVLFVVVLYHTIPSQNLHFAHLMLHSVPGWIIRLNVKMQAVYQFIFWYQCN